MGTLTPQALADTGREITTKRDRARHACCGGAARLSPLAGRPGYVVHTHGGATLGALFRGGAPVCAVGVRLRRCRPAGS